LRHFVPKRARSGAPGNCSWREQLHPRPDPALGELVPQRNEFSRKLGGGGQRGPRCYCGFRDLHTALETDSPVEAGGCLPDAGRGLSRCARPAPYNSPRLHNASQIVCAADPRLRGRRGPSPRERRSSGDERKSAETGAAGAAPPAPAARIAARGTRAQARPEGGPQGGGRVRAGTWMARALQASLWTASGTIGPQSRGPRGPQGVWEVAPFCAQKGQSWAPRELLLA
jgi:hypothetical protein